MLGSGCGSVCRAIASDARGPRFVSSHRQTFISDISLLTYCQLFWKDENKEKEAGNGPFLTQLLGEETLIRGNEAACLEHWAVVGNCKDTADASIGIITLQSPLLTPIRQLNAKFFTSLIKYFQRKGLSKFQRVKNKRTMCVRGGFVVTDIALNSDNPGSKPLKLAFFR